MRDTALLANNVGCTFPTKAIVADFNHDGKPDVFVACRGLGATAFVGEKSAVLLSRPDKELEHDEIHNPAVGRSLSSQSTGLAKISSDLLININDLGVGSKRGRAFSESGCGLAKECDALSE